MAHTTQNRFKPIFVGFSFILLAAALWAMRSWNLEIGDGEFCCKQTIGEQAFAVTLSRSFLSYLLYRFLFFTLHPVLNWWVEDIIALSSCAAGLLFFYALYRLASATSKNKTDFWLLLLFPSTTLILQIFCGHIEFYPWTCALLTLSAWQSWECIHKNQSPLWASFSMALAGGFHSSGVFYFPALLLLPILSALSDGDSLSGERKKWKEAFVTLCVFLAAAILHRKPTHTLYVVVLVLCVPAWFYLLDARRREVWAPWVKILSPWLILFAVRALLRLRAEPLLEHIAPLGEPYDHGAYLYPFFSWDHLYDKFTFFLWLTPFGFAGLLGVSGFCWRKTAKNRWLVFLLNFCVWAMVWYILFYPQLRTRDWDLFASVSIPLNLFVVTAGYFLFRAIPFRLLAGAAIIFQLAVSVPILIENSSLLKGRGYVTVEYAPTPVATHAYIRGLQIGVTPLQQENIRSGKANVRMVPLERGYQSWSEDTFLETGKTYRFDPKLEEIDNRVAFPRGE